MRVLVVRILWRYSIMWRSFKTLKVALSLRVQSCFFSSLWKRVSIGRRREPYHVVCNTYELDSTGGGVTPATHVEARDQPLRKRNGQTIWNSVPKVAQLLVRTRKPHAQLNRLHFIIIGATLYTIKIAVIVSTSRIEVKFSSVTPSSVEDVTQTVRLLKL